MRDSGSTNTVKNNFLRNCNRRLSEYRSNVASLDGTSQKCCSRQVMDIQAALRGPDIDKPDLADILKDVQAQEKQNLRMTATLQVLRKALKPLERVHEMEKKGHHQCSHIHKEESSALELAESDAEFDAAYKEATQTLQEARTAIHEYMGKRYELASSGIDV